MNHLALYYPDAAEATILTYPGVDERVPFEPAPRWACVVAPGRSYYFERRPRLWVRCWQRLLLGWRWVSVRQPTV